MDPDTLTRSNGVASDGWSLLISSPRDTIKPLTYEFRSLRDCVDLLGAAKIDAYRAYCLEWRQSQKGQTFVVIGGDGQLLELSLPTRTLEPASTEEALRQRERIVYVERLLQGRMDAECSELTAWVTGGSDSLAKRLRHELREKQQDGIAVAEAFLRNIDEILLLVLDTQGVALQLIYDFSVGMTEDAGVVRESRVLDFVEMQRFPLEFAAARRVLGPRE